MLTVARHFSAPVTKERMHLCVKSSWFQRDSRKCGMMLRNEKGGQMGDTFGIFQPLCNRLDAQMTFRIFCFLVTANLLHWRKCCSSRCCPLGAKKLLPLRILSWLQ